MFSTNDPAFFFDASFPRVVSEVAISSDRYDAPVSCRIEFSSEVDGKARLTVHGNDATAASGVFRELSRELEARQLPGGWWIRQLDGFLVAFAIELTLAAAVYCAFDFVLDLWILLSPSFKDSTPYNAIAGTGWVCTVFTFAFSGFPSTRFLQRIFPVVQFRGRFEDEGRRLRRHLLWVGSAVLLPILLNVLSSAVTDFIESG